MEVTALCITLLINILVMLPAQVQHSNAHKTDATFPRIFPSRLQFFEYESIFITCEGFFNDVTKWRVMRNIKGTTAVCSMKWETTGPCAVTTAFSTDSGEYWCEAEGRKSNTVNITVTAAPVILGSPAPPVMEGEVVTLSCRNKRTLNSEAYFCKDGLLINIGSAGEMTIPSVSKSDEGLYKCNIPGVGESAESRLAVRAFGSLHEYNDCSPRGFIAFRILGTMLLVALCLVIALLHRGKERFFNLSSLHPRLWFSANRSQTAESSD